MTIKTVNLSKSNKSLASSTASINKLRVNIVDNKKKPSLPIPVTKKESERKLSVPLNNSRKPSLPSTATNLRKGSLVPQKKSLSTTPSGSQSSKQINLLMTHTHVNFFSRIKSTNFNFKFCL